MLNKKVYLTGLAYKLGDIYDIKELDELQINSDLLKIFLKLGLTRYSVSKLTPAEMAKESIIHTLNKGSVTEKEIDALVYATSSFWDSELYNTNTISSLINELNLNNAYPIGVFLSNCSNIHTAIRTAASLVKSEECENILVVTTDKIKEGQTRIIPPRVSIASDAAASCVISSKKGDFEVIHTNQYINPSMGDIVGDVESSEQIQEFMHNFQEGTKKTLCQALGIVAKKPEDFKQVITNNYSFSISNTIGNLGEFKPDQLYTDNIVRFAHALAADNLINLFDYLEKNITHEGELFLLLGTGGNMWGVTILRKT
ncbi:hypothetical protein LC607_35150 [Nostoc sp. CHAB 5824]|nr:hypothetical protein [Nostoc sp. CHAB 5824]